MNNRVTPEKVNYLKPGEVFVFGSNMAGIHGAGAARKALEFGAAPGRGFSHYGDTFAIPTKDRGVRTLPLSDIDGFVSAFIDYAELKSDLTFLVTEIGCGLDGYSPEDIAPMFKGAVELENVHLPQRFWDALNKVD